MPGALDRVDALVIPGGESTTLLRLIGEYGFEGPIREFVASGRPVLATCMGVILLAREVVNPPQRSLGIPITADWAIPSCRPRAFSTSAE